MAFSWSAGFWGTFAVTLLRSCVHRMYTLVRACHAGVCVNTLTYVNRVVAIKVSSVRFVSLWLSSLSVDQWFSPISFIPDKPLSLNVSNEVFFNICRCEFFWRILPARSNCSYGVNLYSMQLLPNLGQKKLSTYTYPNI